jgi:hypothetical protein
MQEHTDSSVVAFLFGAGASAEADLPTTREATDVFLNYSTHCPSDDSHLVENLLRYIQVLIADYLSVRASEVNFEHILGALMELEKRSEYPTAPLLGEGDALVKRLENRMGLGEVIDRLYGLLREMLHVEGNCSYLHPLKGFVEQYGSLDVFTLNYDLSLETALDDLGLSYSVGYTRRGEGQSVWDAEDFGRSDLAVRLYKLHGSVDWAMEYRTSPAPTMSLDADDVYQAQAFLANYPRNVRFAPFDAPNVTPPGRTLGLVGLMNFGTRKELMYALPQYTWLFWRFLGELARARVCVVAGYSFRDERINAYLQDAVVARKGGLRLLIVDKGWYWIRSRTPMLQALDQQKWCTGLETSLGEALSEGRLLAAVQKLAASEPATISPSPMSTRQKAEDRDARERQNPEEIVGVWRQLGHHLDLTHYRFLKIMPQVEQLSSCADIDEGRKVGVVLRPLLRKTRDLCYHIHWLYEAMGFSGLDPDEHLRPISICPEYVGSTADLALARKWLPELGRAVNLVYNTYCLAVDEFQGGIRDPEYGKGIAPSNLSMAERVIRKTKTRICELAWLLNEIVRGVGYEEPFSGIAHWMSDRQ